MLRLQARLLCVFVEAVTGVWKTTQLVILDVHQGA